MGGIKRILLFASVVGIALAGALPAAPAAQASGGDEREHATAGGARPCPAVERVERVGLACLTPRGLLAVYAANGDFLGTTHGVDVTGPEPEVAAASSVSPACREAPGPGIHHTKVIYARPTDVADAYATKKGTILATLANANGYLYDAAVATGGAASIAVECAGGAVVVHNVALSLTRAQAGDFGLVVNDLKSKGFTSNAVKHWVFVDGGATDICSCGVGHIYDDDRLILENYNNGAPGTVPLFAVTWKMDSARIALHEISHNMGAVQKTAPHTSGNFHCNDGLDTMCYQDGGPTQCTSGFLCPGTCATEAYDCGKDDYFHREPATGSYLATHWNVGDPLNRFLEFVLTDTTPPVTTASLAGTVGRPGFYRSAVQVTLSATDPAPGSGVAGTTYALDGGAAQAYTGPFSVGADGAHVVDYGSVDHFGNAEATKSAGFVVDRTLPAQALVGSCSPCVGEVTLDMEVSDPTSGLDGVVLRWQYRGASVGPYVGPTIASSVVCQPAVMPGAASLTASCTFPKWNGLSGTYGFVLSSTDRAGNVATSAPLLVTLV